MRFAVESRTTRELSRRVAQHRERIEETAAIPTSFFFLSFLPFVLPPNLFFSLFPAPYFFSALPRFRLSFVSFLSLPVVEPRSLSTSRRLPPSPLPRHGAVLAAFNYATAKRSTPWVHLANLLYL